MRSRSLKTPTNDKHAAIFQAELFWKDVSFRRDFGDNVDVNAFHFLYPIGVGKTLPHRAGEFYYEQRSRDPCRMFFHSAGKFFFLMLPLL
jgi:hypothetical protein